MPSTIRLGSSFRKDILPIKITGSPSIRKSWTVTSILGKMTVSMLESKSEILTKAIGSPFLVTIFLTVVMIPPIVSWLVSLLTNRACLMGVAAALMRRSRYWFKGWSET